MTDKKRAGNARRQRRAREKKRDAGLIELKVYVTQKEYDDLDAWHGAMVNPPDSFSKFLRMILEKGAAFAVNSGCPAGQKVTRKNGKLGRHDA